MVAVLGLRGRARREGFGKRLWVDGGGKEDQRGQEGRIASGDTLSKRRRVVVVEGQGDSDFSQRAPGLGAVTGRVGLDLTGRGLRRGLVVLTCPGLTGGVRE